MACGNNIQLQLGFFDTYVTSSATLWGELWGVHPRSAGKRRKTAARCAKYMENFPGLGCKTPTEMFMLELGWPFLDNCWQQGALRFWNQLLALPEDDPRGYRLYDMLVTTWCCN